MLMKDLDGNGILDSKEFHAALVSIGIPSPSEEIVHAVMKAADENHDGGIDYKEVFFV